MVSCLRFLEKERVVVKVGLHKSLDFVWLGVVCWRDLEMLFQELVNVAPQCVLHIDRVAPNLCQIRKRYRALVLRQHYQTARVLSSNILSPKIGFDTKAIASL